MIPTVARDGGQVLWIVSVVAPAHARPAIFDNVTYRQLVSRRSSVYYRGRDVCTGGMKRSEAQEDGVYVSNERERKIAWTRERQYGLGTIGRSDFFVNDALFFFLNGPALCFVAAARGRQPAAAAVIITAGPSLSCRLVDRRSPSWQLISC